MNSNETKCQNGNLESIARIMVSDDRQVDALSYTRTVSSLVGHSTPSGTYDF